MKTERRERQWAVMVLALGLAMEKLFVGVVVGTGCLGRGEIT